MPLARRMAALSIGVSSAAPLPYLGGAVNGAHAFHEWARALGYEASLVTDEGDEAGPVTMDRLRAELEGMLPPRAQPVHRLLLYFAGHGLIREAEEGLWLLSDWHTQLRAVAIEVLKRRLYLYGVGQIAIFADACRSLPPDMLASDLTADGVLGLGPIRSPSAPAIDKFVAAQDGTAAYMVPGARPEEDRCIFSGVLLEGLWGTKPAAFSTVLPGKKVTSSSLGAYLRSEVPLVAERYNARLHPSVSPTFPPGDDIYFDEGTEPPARPAFPPWPKPGAFSGMGPETGPSAPRAPVPAHGEEEVLASLWDREPPSRLVRRPPSVAAGAPTFAVEGAGIREVWTSGDRSVEVRTGAVVGAGDWSGIDVFPGGSRRALPVLIEFDDGLFAATTALPGFRAAVQHERKRGVSALLYRRAGEQPASAEAAERAIRQMELGALRADDVTDLAVELRRFKHVDPVLGVISAYLYDSIGDVESIRRMAYYYVGHGQPVPYDVALLAQVRGELRSAAGRESAVIGLRVPATARREPRSQAEERFGWTHAATPEAQGVVGGLWPWMRQGWAFLDDLTADEATLTGPDLIGVRKHLTSARFTTLDAAGGRKLAAMFGLVRRAEGENEPPPPSIAVAR